MWPSGDIHHQRGAYPLHAAGPIRRISICFTSSHSEQRQRSHLGWLGQGAQGVLHNSSTTYPLPGLHVG